MKNKTGTNQYKKKRSLWQAYLFLYFTMVFCLIGWRMAVKMQPKEVTHIISPIAYAKTVEPTPTPTEHELIIAYINQTFGKDAPVAFRLLEKCGENAALDPNVVNTAGNYPPGSRDIGVFMINEYWQKIQAKFLFDWKINIDVAYKLYKENGDSFKLWTGGRRCGI